VIAFLVLFCPVLPLNFLSLSFFVVVAAPCRAKTHRGTAAKQPVFGGSKVQGVEYSEVLIKRYPKPAERQRAIYHPTSYRSTGVRQLAACRTKSAQTAAVRELVGQLPAHQDTGA
jgi:hypothetical protein